MRVSHHAVPHAFAAQAQAIRAMLEQENHADHAEARHLIERGRQDYRLSRK